MLFETLSLTESIFVIAIFGIPMVVAIVIYNWIRRRRSGPLDRDTRSGYTSFSAMFFRKPDEKLDLEFEIWASKYGDLIIAVCSFVIAPLYYNAVTDYAAGSDRSINTLAAILYFLCGKNIPTIGLVVVGLFFLVRWGIRFIRMRQSTK
jgi:hypothetical protein